MQTTEGDAITSMKVRCICLGYFYLKRTHFCIFVQVVGMIMHVLLTGFSLCRGGSRRRNAWERLGRLREGQRGPFHPSKEFHKVWMPSNRVHELLQEVCRGSTGCFRHFYRKSRISTGSSVIPTGCSIIGFQVVGEWKGLHGCLWR